MYLQDVPDHLAGRMTTEEVLTDFHELTTRLAVAASRARRSRA